ncbi:MAG: family transposase [Mucilaginibacter sp.]|nr:family transposase [Mucilaginibacter sp.]
MGAKVVFKPYDPDQLTLLPYKLWELVPQGHPVRIVKQVVDAIDVKPINRKYKGGGASSFHPRLMLKLLVNGYLTNTYSSRKLEDQAAEELKDTAPLSFEEINPEKVKETIAKIDAALDDKEEVSKQVKQRLNYAKKNWPANLERMMNRKSSWVTVTVFQKPTRMPLLCA